MQEEQKLQIEQFTRVEFDVDVVRVTESNMELAAQWCGGDVRTDPDGKRYVKVRVHRPQGDRQSMAYPNDRILYATTGYKVYTPRAFLASFRPSDGSSKPAVKSKPPLKRPRPNKTSGRPVPRPPKKDSQTSHQ